jgi:putative phosphoribosyl transferase
MRFRNRSEAGRRLASRLEFLRGADVVVLALPRGGVPVAAEVARALAVPLDVILVRKLGVPAQPELGLGAIGESGARVINPEVVRYARVSEAEIAQVEQRERAELQRRARRFRGDAPHQPLAGRIAVIVDDGIATGSTARAACQVARALGAARVVLAVPVAPPAADRTLHGDADEVICLEMPERFLAIGEWYEDFAQTSDEEVVALLRAARAGNGQEEQVGDPDGDRTGDPAPPPLAAGAAEPAPGPAGPGQAPGPAGPGQAFGPAAGQGADGPGRIADAPGRIADAPALAKSGDLAGLVTMMPFAAGLGIVLDAAGAGEVRARMAWAPERCTSGGILHGGVLMAFADSLGGICAFLNLPPGALTATTSSATVFTRAVRSGEVTAVTRPLHVGRSVIVVQTDMTDADGRRVAQVTQTQAVLPGRG